MKLYTYDEKVVNIPRKFVKAYCKLMSIRLRDFKCTYTYDEVEWIKYNVMMENNTRAN